MVHCISSVSYISLALVAASAWNAHAFRLGEWTRNEVQEDYLTEEPSTVDSSELSRNRLSYVFLQKFPLEGTNGSIFHTEVVVCAKASFSEKDQNMLDDKISSMTDFTELDGSWWQDVTVSCVELGYGGNPCTEECCSVPHSAQQTNYPLNARRAMIGNADVSEKSLFLYGEGGFDGNEAYHAVCDQKCWSNWAGTDYNLLTNNCNTFTSTVLSCVYGLSEKKPHLGPSDLITVKCEKKSCRAQNPTNADSFKPLLQ